MISLNSLGLAAYGKLFKCYSSSVDSTSSWAARLSKELFTLKECCFAASFTPAGPPEKKEVFVEDIRCLGRRLFGEVNLGMFSSEMVCVFSVLKFGAEKSKLWLSL